MALAAYNNYACRDRNGGAPLVISGVRLANNASRFKEGDPVALSSGNVVAATVASTLLTNATILGFVAGPDASTFGYPSHFQNPPTIQDPDHALDEILIYSAYQDNIHTLPLKSDQATAKTMVGTAYDLGYNSSTGIWYVDTTSTATATAKIIGIYPGELGVAGGRVDFVVPAAKFALA